MSIQLAWTELVILIGHNEAIPIGVATTRDHPGVLPAVEVLFGVAHGLQ